MPDRLCCQVETPQNSIFALPVCRAYTPDDGFIKHLTFYDYVSPPRSHADRIVHRRITDMRSELDDGVVLNDRLQAVILHTPGHAAVTGSDLVASRILCSPPHVWRAFYV